MKTFKDNAGRTWTVAVNVAAVKRCRALVGVDLYGLVDDGFAGLGKLLNDPVTLVDVLYVLCKDEADKQGITDEDFGRAMAGDALGAAADAFVEEFTDFFPDPRVRAGLKGVVEKGRAVAALVLEESARRIERVDPASEARRLTASSGGAPASSASTPGRSPSAS